MACLDTSFLIDVLDGDEDARDVMETLDEEGVRHGVTPVSAAELWIGAHQGVGADYRQTGELLESLLWLEFTRSCARRAGALQADVMAYGNRLGFNDCVIAATAIEHGHALVTADADFEKIPDLTVRTY